MALSQTESATIEKARAAGVGGLGVDLDDETCAYLVALIAKDLRLTRPPGFPARVSSFFDADRPDTLRLPGLPFWPAIERLADADRNVVTYFACLAKLHKARVKYAAILKTQPVPTMEQVGPRGLLQYGTMTPRALTGFLLWRKWMYDIDNRAAQETGYLFEPIIAHSIGGVPVGAGKSPVRRHDDPTKGRQVDCVKRKRAYEIKLRVTIAASGQGRWREELDFPVDCRASGYTPVLIVFDPTPNPKLRQLVRAFESHRGAVHVGPAAWNHLDQQAGPSMARFLEKYVREPLDALLREVPTGPLPDLVLRTTDDSIRVSVGPDTFVIPRAPRGEEAADDDALPEDIDDTITGP
jgi:hypothetical protein